jgi:hypothetical protein
VKISYFYGKYDNIIFCDAKKIMEINYTIFNKIKKFIYFYEKYDDSSFFNIKKTKIIIWVT